CAPSGSTAFSAAKTRSEPDGRPGSVSTALPPAASTAATISGSAAATTTGPIFAATACRQTQTIMGTPPMGASGLPGRRVEAIRAGISTMGLMTGFRETLIRFSAKSFRYLCDASPREMRGVRRLMSPTIFGWAPYGFLGVEQDRGRSAGHADLCHGCEDRHRGDL